MLFKLILIEGDGLHVRDARHQHSQHLASRQNHRAKEGVLRDRQKRGLIGQNRRGRRGERWKRVIQIAERIEKRELWVELNEIGLTPAVVSA